MKRIEARSLGLLTVNQAAELRAVHPRTILNWIASDVLPAVVIPGERESYLIRERDLARVKPPRKGPAPGTGGRPRGPDAGRKLPATGA